MLVHAFLKLCICFTTAYCFEITVAFMAAAVVPEYNSPVLLMCASLWSTVHCSPQLYCVLCCSLLCSAPSELRHVLLCPLLPCSPLLCSAPGLLLYICSPFSSALFHFILFWRALLCYVLSAHTFLSSPLFSPLLS